MIRPLSAPLLVALVASAAPAQTPLDRLAAADVRARVALFLKENPQRAEELLAPAGVRVGLDPALIQLQVVDGKPAALLWPYKVARPLSGDQQATVSKAVSAVLREALEVYRVNDQPLLLPDDAEALAKLYRIAPVEVPAAPPAPAPAPVPPAPGELLTDLSKRVVVATYETPAVVTFAARLPGVPEEQVRLEATTGNASLLPQEGLVIGPVDADGARTLTITPAAGALGAVRVTLRVVGPAGVAATTVLTVQVGAEGAPLAPVPVAVVPPDPLPMGPAGLFAPGMPLHRAPGWTLVFRPAEYGGSFPFYVGPWGYYTPTATMYVNPWAQPGVGSTGGIGTAPALPVCLDVKYPKAELLRGRTAADAPALAAYGRDHLKRGYPAQAAEAFAAAEALSAARSERLASR